MKGTPSAPQCGFSRATVQILGLQGVDPKKFASYNVLEDNELRSGTAIHDLTLGIKEYSEWPTVPQLYVNGEFVGGCDIVMNMHQSGELEKVLEGADVLVPAETEEVGTTEGGEVLVGQGTVEEIGVVHGEEPGGKKQDVRTDPKI
jgi:Grx4 family monothiol glutaredoxin